MKHMLLAVLSAIVLGSFLIPQQALALRLQLNAGGGGAEVTLNDGAPGDASSDLGVVTFIGPVVGGTSNWNVNVTTGLSYPELGSQSRPHMDLNSVNRSVGPATLTILLSEQNFTNPGAPGAFDFSALIGGTAQRTVTYQTYWSASNSLFALDNLITSSGSLGPGAFANTRFGSGAGIAGPFSLTQVVTITHTAGGQTTSFDAELSVPEPASVILLGLALLGLGVWSRRALKTQN